MFKNSLFIYELFGYTCARVIRRILGGYEKVIFNRNYTTMI